MKDSLAAFALLAGLLPFTPTLSNCLSLPVLRGPERSPAQEASPEAQDAAEMAELFVIVTDDDGDPVFKASVSLNVSARVMEEGRKNGQVSFPVPTERTDPEGEAILEVEPGEARTLSVSCRDLGSEYRKIEIPALKPGESRDIEVRLRTKDDAVFQARVVDDATGEPVADVDVQEAVLNNGFSSEDVRLVRSSSPLLTTAEDGTFQVAAATWRRKSVTLMAPGYAPVRCIVGGEDGFPGQDSALEVRLKAGCSLRVELASAPDDARVKVSFYNSSIDYQPATVPGSRTFSSFQIEGVPDAIRGGFVVHDIPPSAEATTVVSSGRTVLMERRFTPGEGGEELTQSFDLESNGSITGTLRTVDGEPVVDYRLVIVAATGGGGKIDSYADIIETATTAEDGTFSFDGLTARKYKVGAKMAYRMPADSMIVDTKVVDLTAGAPEAKPLELVLMQGMSIRGRVIGPDGKAGRGHIYVRNLEGGWFAQGSTLGEDESFEVGPLLPGTYSVSTNSSEPDYASALPAEAVAGATDLVLQLREAGNISGRIVDAATGEPLVGEVSYMEHRDANRMMQGFGDDATSTFEFKKMAAGPGLVVAEVKGVGFSAVTAVTIKPGETTSDVVLKVAPAAAFTVDAGSRTGLSYAIVNVDGYKGFARFDRESGAGEVKVPTGDALVTFNLADSKDTYQIRVKATPGEVIRVSADDATLVPAPASVPAASPAPATPESPKADDSSAEPIK